MANGICPRCGTATVTYACLDDEWPACTTCGLRPTVDMRTCQYCGGRFPVAELIDLAPPDSIESDWKCESCIDNEPPCAKCQGL